MLNECMYDVIRLYCISSQLALVKPGALGIQSHAPGFLKLLWFTRWYVCASAPGGINNQWHYNYGVI